jgi:DNA-binding transcriptional MerR regulator
MAKSAPNGKRTLTELAEDSGVPARTIRYYIARGVMPPPLVGGRGASYAEEHLERLERIQKLQAQGLTLAQIAWKLGEHPLERQLVEPTAWWNYPVAEDVVVMVRSEMRPWRLKRVRSLISQMAAQLRSAEKEEGGDAR